MSRRVNVLEAPQVVSSLVYDTDSKGFKPAEIGTVLKEEYEDDGLWRFYFQSNVKGSDPTELGIMKKSSRIVDPITAISPLLEEGWQIKEFYPWKNGTNFKVEMVHPDHQPIPDPLYWDRDLWRNAGNHEIVDDGALEPNLRESIIIEGALSPKRSFIFNRGLYRLVCRNGLTHVVMDFGRIRISHNTFNRDALVTQVGAFEALGNDNERIMGPVLGSPVSAGRTATFLRRNFLDPDDSDGPAMERIPNFLRDVEQTFSRLPKWFLGGYATQLELMDQRIDRDIRGLDVLNGITNVINLSRNDPDEDHAYGRIFSRQDNIFEATEKLLGIFSMN